MGAKGIGVSAPPDHHRKARLFTARNYQSRIGLIGGHSRSFCYTCNKVCVTPLGMLKIYLYGKEVLDFKKMLCDGYADQALFEQNWRIKHDAHAGVWHRQVPLLAGESIDAVRKKIPDLRHGVFAENLVTRHIDLTELTIGDRLCLGAAVVLEVTQIGKKCHNDGCVIKKKTGDCIMPRESLFCRVITGGDVKVGNSCAPCGFNAEKCLTNRDELATSR